MPAASSRGPDASSTCFVELGLLDPLLCGVGWVAVSNWERFSVLCVFRFCYPYSVVICIFVFCVFSRGITVYCVCRFSGYAAGAYLYITLHIVCSPGALLYTVFTGFQDTVAIGRQRTFGVRQVGAPSGALLDNVSQLVENAILQTEVIDTVSDLLHCVSQGLSPLDLID
ncbi:hypothetical protein CEXT_103091 [Caerostris extrusa]|uniref:Uncharacterized protein n=1 Tax=Caerostris extrusa TaxID=172846 RepID=A0AAV4X2W5_CAEEX|nr:hypothetical protein CEXT_103091 [Caerostris extrusa]